MSKISHTVLGVQDSRWIAVPRCRRVDNQYYDFCRCLGEFVTNGQGAVRRTRPPRATQPHARIQRSTQTLRIISLGLVGTVPASYGVAVLLLVLQIDRSRRIAAVPDGIDRCPSRRYLSQPRP